MCNDVSYGEDITAAKLAEALFAKPSTLNPQHNLADHRLGVALGICILKVGSKRSVRPSPWVAFVGFKVSEFRI